MNRIVATVGVLSISAATTLLAAPEPCRITVVEKGSGWPVPLVELRTTHQVRFVTDNAGVIAFDLPELMGSETWFDVIGHGYSTPPDGFGFSGTRLVPTPGGKLKIEVIRSNIAKRLGRLTGAGLFAESQKLGDGLDEPPTGVVGCDSVQNAVHDGKLFWAWGDTTLARYPLGIFDMTSATSPIQPLTSFEPPVRLRLHYFTDAQGAPRGVAKMPGSGPTWVSGYVSLPDQDGHGKLVGSYIKVKPPMDAYEAGLCVWDDSAAAFKQQRVLWTKTDANPKQPLMPGGHPAFWKDSQGTEWILFGNPLPNLRCPATFEAWAEPLQMGGFDPAREPARGNRRNSSQAPQRLDCVEPLSEPVDHRLYASLWQAVRFRRAVVCGGGYTYWSVGQGGESAHPLELHFLQPALAPGVHAPRITHPVVRRQLHG